LSGGCRGCSPGSGRRHHDDVPWGAPRVEIPLLGGHHPGWRRRFFKGCWVRVSALSRFMSQCVAEASRGWPAPTPGRVTRRARTRSGWVAIPVRVVFEEPYSNMCWTNFHGAISITTRTCLFGGGVSGNGLGGSMAVKHRPARSRSRCSPGCLRTGGVAGIAAAAWGQVLVAVLIAACAGFPRMWRPRPVLEPSPGHVRTFWPVNALVVIGLAAARVHAWDILRTARTGVKDDDTWYLMHLPMDAGFALAVPAAAGMAVLAMANRMGNGWFPIVPPSASAVWFGVVCATHPDFQAASAERRGGARPPGDRGRRGGVVDRVCPTKATHVRASLTSVADQRLKPQKPQRSRGQTTRSAANEAATRARRGVVRRALSATRATAIAGTSKIAMPPAK
jgi:hypothetical protein